MRSHAMRQSQQVWYWPAILIGFTLASFLLRLFCLGNQEIWLDEALSVHRAMAAGGLRPDLLIDPSPPLYYALLRLSIIFFGTDEFSVRLLSAIVGTLFVPVLMVLAKEVFHKKAAVWTGLIAAVAPIHIYYSQESRPYALLLLLLTCTYLFLWRAVTLNSKTAWTLTTIAAIGSLYTHYFAVLGLLPTFAVVLLYHDRTQWKRTLWLYSAAMLSCSILYIPWLIWAFIYSPQTSAVMDWIRSIWELTPPALALPKTWQVFAVGGQHGVTPLQMKQFSRVDFPPFLQILGSVTALFIALIALLPIRSSDTSPEDSKRGTLALLIWVVTPLIGLLMISIFRPVYVVGRYDVIAFPPFLILLGVGLAKLQAISRRGWMLAIVTSVAFLVPIGAKLFQYYMASPLNEARQRAAVLNTNMRNGDVVVFTGLAGLPVLYYLSQQGYHWNDGVCENPQANRRFGCRMFPKETEHAPATYDPRRVLASLTAVRDDLDEFLAGLDSTDNRLLVAFAESESAASDLVVPEPDIFLVGQLAHRGLTAIPLAGRNTGGIFEFRPSPPR